MPLLPTAWAPYIFLNNPGFADPGLFQFSHSRENPNTRILQGGFVGEAVHTPPWGWWGLPLKCPCLSEKSGEPGETWPARCQRRGPAYSRPPGAHPTLPWPGLRFPSLGMRSGGQLVSLERLLWPAVPSAESGSEPCATLPPGGQSWREGRAPDPLLPGWWWFLTAREGVRLAQQVLRVRNLANSEHEVEQRRKASWLGFNPIWVHVFKSLF